MITVVNMPCPGITNPGATTKSGAEMVDAEVETQNRAGDYTCGLKKQQC
jgi:hypothetical protein